MSNSLGLTLKDYSGGKSTLCTGCGHDSVTQQIIKAYYQSGVHPNHVAKLSGIGCSSKTPAYFMNSSHGFNTIHGRMASIATGAGVANVDLKIIGISGDGDSASIGLGGFLHLLRRNLTMVYIIENNGVYGLTKGQFSATADSLEIKKDGEENLFSNMDLCALAIQAGCGFVARSFSGDSKELAPLIQAAIKHEGTAVIDVISPCITYANHLGSHKSYDYVKEHQVALQELGYISESDESLIDGDQIQFADGSKLRIRKISSMDHDLNDPLSAQRVLHEASDRHEIITGLLYHSTKQPLSEKLKISKTPLAHMTESDLRPSTEAFKSSINRYK